MRRRLGLCAIVLVLAALLFRALLPNGDAAQSLKRAAERDETGLSQSALGAIRLRLKEIGAPESTRRDQLVRVTEEPFPVAPQVARMCANPFRQDPHQGKSIHVFVTSGGCDTMKTGKGVYPRGTVILKEKFIDADGTKPVLFTGMLKRERGYNAEAGDWQFFVLNANATRVETENTRSCIHCHAPFRDTDFVSRKYLVEKVAVDR